MNTQTILSHYDNVMYSQVYEEYYNQSGFFNFGYWLRQTSSQNEASENLVEKLMDFLPRKNGNILDVACGMGATAKHLLKYYDEQSVIGINISVKQLKSCKVNVPSCNFLLMNATNLAFDDCSIDSMICVEAAFHFNTRSEFLREAYRALKSGGMLILSDVILTAISRVGTRYVPIDNCITNLDEYKKAFLDVGFLKVEVIDATKECWGGWRRYIIRWFFKKLIAGRVSFYGYAGAMLGPVLGGAVIKKYILVAARKL